MEIFLIYLWGIYPQVGTLVATAIPLIVTGIVASLVATVLTHYVLDEETGHAHYSPWAKRASIAVVVVLVLQALIPTRNVAVMMISAPTIVSLAHTAADSNATAQIGTILQNSLNYLEKASASLTEVPAK